MCVCSTINGTVPTDVNRPEVTTELDTTQTTLDRQLPPAPPPPRPHSYPGHHEPVTFSPGDPNEVYLVPNSDDCYSVVAIIDDEISAAADAGGGDGDTGVIMSCDNDEYSTAAQVDIPHNVPPSGVLSDLPDSAHTETAVVMYDNEQYSPVSEYFV